MLNHKMKNAFNIRLALGAMNSECSQADALAASNGDANQRDAIAEKTRSARYAK